MAAIVVHRPFRTEPASVRVSAPLPDGCARRAHFGLDRSTSMNVRPLHDRLIVERLEESEQRAGSIIIPDSAKEKPQQGKVLAAGLGRSNPEGKRIPVEVKA